MSKVFFESLGIPEADIHLNVGSGTHAQQVGNTMIAFEKVLKKEQPDWVVVVGDVNATLACSVTAKKEHVKVCLTDSGGLQEECCVLGTPCLTLRWNTERPITLKEHGGASTLVGNNAIAIREAYQKVSKIKRKPQRPELWDGKAAERCLQAILEYTA